MRRTNKLIERGVIDRVVKGGCSPEVAAKRMHVNRATAYRILARNGFRAVAGSWSRSSGK